MCWATGQVFLKYSVFGSEFFHTVKRKEKTLRGIEPGSPEWQGILMATALLRHADSFQNFLSINSVTISVIEN